MKYRLLLLVASIAFSPVVQAQYYGQSNSIQPNFSIGLKLGLSAVQGEVANDLGGASQVGVYANIPFAKALDLRLQLGRGRALGLAIDPSTDVCFRQTINGTANNGIDYCPNGQELPFFDAYQTDFYNGAFQLKLNLNRLGGSENYNWDLYVLGGLGTLLYRTRQNLLNENKLRYDFSQIPQGEPTQTREALDNLFDETYETAAEQDVLAKTSLGDRYFTLGFYTGAGLRVRLSDRWAVGLEAQWVFTRDDFLDGRVQFDENGFRLPPQEANFDRLFSGALTFDYTFGRN